MQVLTFIVAWAMVRDDLGREPTIDEYAKWWKQSERTAYREQALFRQALPGEKSPSRLIDVTSAQWDARKGLAGVGAVQLA